MRTRTHAPAVLDDTFAMIARPATPCELAPDGIPGLVHVNGRDYAIGYHAELPEQGEPVITGYWMQREGRDAYDLRPVGGVLVCDCGDCAFREHFCKHGLSVMRLIEQGDVSPPTPRR